MSGRTDGDARSQLTWRGLLHAAVPKLTVFYSEGEEVLTNLPEDLPADPGLPADEPQGKYAFSIQAMLKRLQTDEPDVSQGAWYMPWENFVGKFGSFVTHAFEGMSPASPHGGWGWDIGSEDEPAPKKWTRGVVRKILPTENHETRTREAAPPVYAGVQG